VGGEEGRKLGKGFGETGDLDDVQSNPKISVGSRIPKEMMAK